MSRLRALWWALLLLAVAWPGATAAVLDTVGQGARWALAQPAVVLTLAAGALLWWALVPRRPSGGEAP